MPEAAFQLVVGLGNPGAEFRETRHNAGFMVLEAFAQQKGLVWEKCPLAPAQWARLPDNGLRLLKPLSFMNRSGGAVAAVAHYYKMEPASVLVVLDDLALPLGRMRLRDSGSAGGHNGLDSILTSLGTRQIPRLRLGIGAAPGSAGYVPHVLGRFSEDEAPRLREMIERSTQALQCALDAGWEIAKNRFNIDPDAVSPSSGSRKKSDPSSINPPTQ